MKKRWCAPLRSEADGEPDVEHRIRLEALQLILESRLLRRSLALHCRALRGREPAAIGIERRFGRSHEHDAQVRVEVDAQCRLQRALGDRKSTRLNSSHSQISYAVFCLKKKKKKKIKTTNI